MQKALSILVVIPEGNLRLYLLFRGFYTICIRLSLTVWRLGMLCVVETRRLPVPLR